jgi:hypothetical protein
MSSSDILKLIENDPHMMQILEAAERMHLPDWLIGAGFVRNKVWDYVHDHIDATPPTDIDLAYFHPEEGHSEKELEAALSAMVPGAIWEVVNQATVHQRTGNEPFVSTADAISKWPETATAIGVTLDNGVLRLVAPHGIDDLVNVIARPTPTFMASEEMCARVRGRIDQKMWLKKWPKLCVQGV